MKTKTVWISIIIYIASGLLYLTNSFPTGTPPDTESVNLIWPTVYTCITFIFISLLILGTCEPPSQLKLLVIKYFSENRIIKLLIFSCLTFYAITSIALFRRLSRDGWSADEIVILIIVSGSAGLFVWALARDISVRLAVIYIGVAGFLLRLTAFWSIPLDVEQADMLPLIQSANKIFLSGESPYRLYDLHSWPLPLTYLPVKWLAYLPAIIAGLDLRFTNAIAEILILLIFSFSQPPREQKHNFSADILISGLLYLSPAVVIFDWYTEFPVFWVITLAVYGFLLREQFWIATLLWGLSIATSPLNWVISPFIAAYLFSRVSLYQYLKLCAFAAFIVFLVISPFMLWSPQDFIFGTLTWFNDLDIAGRSSWILANRRQLFQIGFSGWFWYFSWENTLKPIQALLVLLVFVFFWNNRQKNEWLLLSSLWAYTLFIFFNVIIWPYFYVLPLWLLALYTIHRRVDSQKEAVVEP